MPIKLSLGLSKKIGQPDYGSLGASCHVEVELPSDLLTQDLQGFHKHVRNVYVTCRQAVQDELARHNNPADPLPIANGHQASNGAAARRHCQQLPARRNPPRPATASQVRALDAIAHRQQIDLPDVLQHRFGTSSAAELSLAEASSLIDELKAIPAGNAGGS